jgi:hypothetical protein
MTVSMKDDIILDVSHFDLLCLLQARVAIMDRMVDICGAFRGRERI